MLRELITWAGILIFIGAWIVATVTSLDCILLSDADPTASVGDSENSVYGDTFSKFTGEK